MEYSFPRLFIPWNIHSHDGTFVLGTIRSLELSFSRLFVPWNICSLDHSFPGLFVPENKHCRPSLLGPFVHSRYTQTVDRRYSGSHLNRFSSSECGLLNNTFGTLHCELKKSTMSACVFCNTNVTSRQ